LDDFKIGQNFVGLNHSCYIIAEIGYNFNTVEEGIASIDEAAKCGVDAVKFQTFRAETVTSRLNEFPDEAGGGSQFDEFKRYEMSEEQHIKLFEYAKNKGLDAFSTPSYYDDAELLMKIGVPAFKTGADDLTNLPFLEYLAKQGLPMIVSTGMGTMAEVAMTVETILSTGNDKLVLLHTVSNYPIKELSEVNLNAMVTMRNAFNVFTGYSDHTTNLFIPMAAAALGMEVYERHFTIDKNLPAPDASLSADPKEMKQIVMGIREIESALGNGVKQPAKTEIDMRKDARKSVIATRNLKSGHKITKGDLIIKRPAWGIQPSSIKDIYDLKLARSVKKDEPITWDHLK
jgi:N-acetylneuraminate synthase